MYDFYFASSCSELFCMRVWWCFKEIACTKINEVTESHGNGAVFTPGPVRKKMSDHWETTTFPSPYHSRHFTFQIWMNCHICSDFTELQRFLSVLESCQAMAKGCNFGSLLTFSLVMELGYYTRLHVLKLSRICLDFGWNNLYPQSWLRESRGRKLKRRASSTTSSLVSAAKFPKNNYVKVHLDYHRLLNEHPFWNPCRNQGIKTVFYQPCSPQEVLRKLL